MKLISTLLLMPFLFVLYMCSNQYQYKSDGYRYVSFEKIPKGDMGKVIGKPYWLQPHYIKELKADSFFVYGSFDSIRMATPAESFGCMFRKTDIRAESWKAKAHYGDLKFVGNFTADHLPGMYVSYYYTKDRSSIMQLLYTNPGNMVDAIIFHKDSINILNKAGIIIDPRDEQ